MYSALPPDMREGWFVAEFKENADGSLTSVMVDHQGHESFRRRGVPDEVLLYVHRKLQRIIFSSTTGKDAGELCRRQRERFGRGSSREEW